MMDRSEFAQAMERLFSYFNRQLNKTLLEEWYKEFGKLPEATFFDAVSDAISERRSPPSLNEMRGHVRKHDPRAQAKLGRGGGAKLNTSEFQGDEKDLEFSRQVAPEFFKLLAAANKRGRNAENVEKLFRSFISHARGVAMKLGILDRVDWAEFDGQFGCRMPGDWRNEGKDADTSRGSRPENDGRVE